MTAPEWAVEKAARSAWENGHRTPWDATRPEERADYLDLAKFMLDAVWPETTTEWGVARPARSGLHRGPWTEGEAREWVQEAEAAGFVPGAFVVVSREVTEWRGVQT